MPVEADRFPLADRLCPATESAQYVPGALASAERDHILNVVVGDATALALCGLAFASVASSRPDTGRSFGEAGGGPS